MADSFGPKHKLVAQIEELARRSLCILDANWECRYAAMSVDLMARTETFILSLPDSGGLPHSSHSFHHSS